MSYSKENEKSTSGWLNAFLWNVENMVYIFSQERLLINGFSTTYEPSSQFVKPLSSEVKKEIVVSSTIRQRESIILFLIQLRAVYIRFNIVQQYYLILHNATSHGKDVRIEMILNSLANVSNDGNPSILKFVISSHKKHTGTPLAFLISLATSPS